MLIDSQTLSETILQQWKEIKHSNIVMNNKDFKEGQLQGLFLARCIISDMCVYPEKYRR